jgi:hypothetical protein
MRGKKLTEVLTAEEIRKKTEQIDEPVPVHAPAAMAQQRISEPYGLPPPPEKPGFVAKMSGLRSRVAKYLKRAAILALILTIVLVAHASDPVRIRVASLLGTTASSPLVQTASTAIPFAVVIAVAVTWFMEAG